MRKFKLLCIILVLITLIGCGPSPTEIALRDLDEVLSAQHIAVLELEVAISEHLETELLAWNVMNAALEQVWEALPADKLNVGVTDSRYMCWHVEQLDGDVDGNSFQAWRCKFIGEACVPAYDHLCIDTGSDGIHWEFRFDDEDLGMLTF